VTLLVLEWSLSPNCAASPACPHGKHPEEVEGTLLGMDGKLPYHPQMMVMVRVERLLVRTKVFQLREDPGGSMLERKDRDHKGGISDIKKGMDDTLRDEN